MEQEDKYIVYYSRNNYLPLFLIMDILLLPFAIGLIISPYTDTVEGILFLIVILVIGIFVIVKIKNAKEEKLVLLEIDQNGILDRNPVDSKGYIKWKDVSYVDLVKGARGTSALLLTLKELDVFKYKKRYISTCPLQPQVLKRF